jgi:hypothetical protein
MIDETDITLCEPAPFLYHENGQLAVTDGATVWLVIVTCEAMKATASPAEKSLKRLIRYAEYYRDLAAAAIARGEDVDGKVWVTEAAVMSSKPHALTMADGTGGRLAQHGS